MRRRPIMRRPPIKRLRQNWIRWVPESRRAEAWANFCRQERWARKHGVLVLQVILGTFFVIVFAQLVAAWTIEQQSKGGFEVQVRGE